MPALNFQKQFADKVESGKKRQTIRALRKDGRNPQQGQTLYLYTGMRTKGCRKLGEAICKDVPEIYINSYGQVVIGTNFLTLTETNKLSKDDGFNTIADFIDFFRQTHGLPFDGLLIKW